MIARYTREKMGQVFSEQNRLLNWLIVETKVIEVLVLDKKIPTKEGIELLKLLKDLIAKGGVSSARVEEIEKTTRHDVIAFTTAVAEQIGPLSRYVHFGLTSNDVIDTAAALQMSEGVKLIRGECEKLCQALLMKADETREVATIGRSHGIFAEPTSFGLKFLGFYAEFKRNLKRLEAALETISYGKLSGAVGVNGHFGVEFEEKTLGSLGLKREWVSTQVVPRDRHAEVLSAFALVGASIERVAIELRHLQRSEVGELREGFKKGQKGSSAMPHKRNPISSENLTGCARLLRSYAQVALENVALWHERDISHSAAERVALVDAFILTDYALARLTDVVSHLDIDAAQIQKNLEKAGKAVYSGHFLLALVEKGVSREEAYAWVQACALKSFEESGDFLELLKKHEGVKKALKSDEIDKLGSIHYQLRNVGAIFDAAHRLTV